MSAEILVDSVLEGKVIRLKPFGAVVQLNDSVQGLVHISHVSSRFVQDINEYLAVGDVVKVKVLSIDAESGKISLSMKETEEFKRPEKPRREQRDFRLPSDTNEAPLQYSKPASQAQTFEEKFKEWIKNSNELHASINKRNKRR